MADRMVVLNEDERKLLVALGKKKEDNVYSVEDLAHETGYSVEEVEKTLSSLEQKGYLRVAKLLETSPLSGSTNERVVQAIRDALDCSNKLERISVKRIQIKERTYEKIRNELIQKLEAVGRNIETMLDDLQKERPELDRRIEEINGKIEETRIRADISEIGPEEADKLIKSYEADLETIKSKRESALTILKEPRNTLEKRKRHGEISVQIEELQARHIVGEVTREEYKRRKSELEAEQSKLEKEIEASEVVTENRVTEMLLKLAKLRDDAVVSQETYARMVTLLEKLIKSKVAKS